MTLRHAIALLTILLGTSLVHAQTPAPPTPAPPPLPMVAVLPIRSGIVDSEAVKAMGESFATELLHTGKVRVMEREQMQAILKEQGFEASGACDQGECAVQMGKLLAVDEMILGSLSRVGTLFSLNLRLVKVQTGEVLRSFSGTCPGRKEDVLTALIPKAVRELTGAGPAPVPAPKAVASTKDTASDDDDSDDTPKDGWQHTFVTLTASSFRASDTTDVRTGALTLDLSKAWKSGVATLTPSLDLLYQKDIVHDTVLRSATGQILGEVAPTSWLTLASAGYYTSQTGPDDFGGYGKVTLSPKMEAHFKSSLSGTVSDDHLGSPFPSSELTFGQDFDPFEWSLNGDWSYQSVSYGFERLHTNAKGKSDTTETDTSKYINEWGAGLSMRAKGESWSTGPFTNVTLQWTPLGTDVIAVVKSKTAVARKTQNQIAKNETLELGWNGTLSPKDWLDIDFSVSNVWAKEDISLTRKGTLTVSRAELAQRAKYLQDKATPPAAGLNLSLGATADF